MQCRLYVHTAHFYQGSALQEFECIKGPCRRWISLCVGVFWWSTFCVVRNQRPIGLHHRAKLLIEECGPERQGPGLNVYATFINAWYAFGCEIYVCDGVYNNLNNMIAQVCTGSQVFVPADNLHIFKQPQIRTIWCVLLRMILEIGIKIESSQTFISWSWERKDIRKPIFFVGECLRLYSMCMIAHITWCSW